MRGILARAAVFGNQHQDANDMHHKVQPVPDATITVQLAPAPGTLHPKLGKLTTTILASTSPTCTSEPGSPKSGSFHKGAKQNPLNKSFTYKAAHKGQQPSSPAAQSTAGHPTTHAAVTAAVVATTHAATATVAPKAHHHTDFGAHAKLAPAHITSQPATTTDRHSHAVAHEKRAPTPHAAAADPAAQEVSTSAPLVSLSDFEMGRVIGAGSFGRVSVARHKGTGGVYVIKALSKSSCVQQGHVQHVLDEKTMLARVTASRHPFFVTLHTSFQDASCLYLVLDFVPGGDMFAFLRDLPRRTGRKMPEMHARFYAAQLVLALEHLHSQGIAYRDLKPENVLIDADGYLKLGDFGFAKAVGQRGVTRSFCGTPDYLAPEVVFQRGHGVSVDWWALGCVIYEMLYGFPPFYGNGNHQETYRRITEHYTGATRPHYPDTWTAWVKDLVSGLLHPDPLMRLGTGEGGMEAIKNHAWFQGLDWSLVSKRMYIAPYKPPAPVSPAPPATPTCCSTPADAIVTPAPKQGTKKPSRNGLDNLTGCFDDFATLSPMKHPFVLSADEQQLFASF